jgi:hypothetical protein
LEAPLNLPLPPLGVSRLCWPCTVGEGGGEGQTVEVLEQVVQHLIVLGLRAEYDAADAVMSRLPPLVESHPEGASKNTVRDACEIAMV